MMMRRFDSRHFIFHVLVALYFIWVVVFTVLMGMSLVNVYGPANIPLAQLFMELIFLNLVMGSVLFIVIRLFRNETLLNKIIFYSYAVLAIASVVTAVIVSNMV